MKETILNVVNFIIEGHTIEETSDHFQKSKSSIKKYLAKARDPQSEYYDKTLAEKLALSQTKIILMGQKKGGEIGKRKGIRSEKEKLRLAQQYMKGLTFAQLSSKENIPISTLHETIRSIPDAELQNDIDEYIYGKSR